MRAFTLSDAAASELWTALNKSTAAEAPQIAPPIHAPPIPAPAPAAPPKSELETIIAGARYTPAQAGFPNGWPPFDPVQASAAHKDTDYIHTDSKGGGYYTLPGFAERQSKPLPNINASASPRRGLGLLAVLMSVGLTQEFRDRAFNAIIAGGGSGDTINANAQADPTWNAEVRHMLEGAAPETDELRAAKAIADAL